MTEDGPAATRAVADGDGADVASPPAGRRPFARPTPTLGARPTPVLRPIPFVAPGDPEHELEALAIGGGGFAGEGVGRGDRAMDATPEHPVGAAGDGNGGHGATHEAGTPGSAPAAAMIWADAREVHAALALESLAGRLRAGRLRLPVAVDHACVPALVAAVLAAVHAEAAGTSAPPAAGPAA